MGITVGYPTSGSMGLGLFLYGNTDAAFAVAGDIMIAYCTLPGFAGRATARSTELVLASAPGDWEVYFGLPLSRPWGIPQQDPIDVYINCLDQVTRFIKDQLVVSGTYLHDSISIGLAGGGHDPMLDQILAAVTHTFP